MSRSVVFNESVMSHDDLSTDIFDVEPQRVTVQVEHLDEEEHVIDDNVDDAPNTEVHNDDVVQHSPLILQWEIQPLVDGGSKRVIKKPKRLIEEYDIVHYAFSCAEQVENIHEPSTYTEACFR